MSTKRNRLPSGIKRLADGRYHVRAAVTDRDTGKRIWRKKTLETGFTLVQAIEALEMMKTTALETPPPEGEDDPDVVTLGDYAKQWIERKARRWRPRVTEIALCRLENHILPFWAETTLQRVSRQRVLRWRDAIQEQIGEFALETVRGWWRLGLQLIRDALADYELHDCTRRIEPPFGEATLRREQRTLNRQEIAALIEALRARCQHWIVIAVAAYTGCRIGEATAVRWCDVNLDVGVVTIRRSAVALSGGGQQLTLPKNGRERIAGIPPELRRLLEEHRAECPGVGEALLSPTRDGGPVWRSGLARILEDAARELGIEARVTPQVLRRTWNTLALEAGVDHEVLRSMIGHASAAMTRRYHGVRPETVASVAAQVWPAGVAREGA